MSQAKIIELILTHSVAGKGVEEDPYRRVTELWTKDGVLVVAASYKDYPHDTMVFLENAK